MSYTIEQLSVSTAEEELNYFFSYPAQDRVPMESGSAMPSGTYRVVNGRLYLILPGVPPLPELTGIEQNNNT